jgi:transcriptional regulator with XRE-family HTH domain
MSDKNPATSRIAELIARAQQAGVSQGAVARALGLTSSEVSRWKRGEVTPRSDNLLDLERVVERLTGRSGGSASSKSARQAIPTAVRNKVLGLFRHRCAICGRDKPQMHHIDENPGNNDELNLLPLCPNHHLVDVHDPTAPLDPLKLRLFREYRDPSILAPEFHPIFRRLRFVLDPSEVEDVDAVHKRIVDFVGFLNQFDKGPYYHVKVHDLLPIHPFREIVLDLHEPPEHRAGRKRHHDEIELVTFRKTLDENRQQILSLVIEMLRYQPWAERIVHQQLRNS